MRPWRRPARRRPTPPRRPPPTSPAPPPGAFAAPPPSERVGAALRLSQEERRFLLAAEKGEGLFFARGGQVALKVEASPTEHRLATTAPRELAALAAAPPAGRLPRQPKGAPDA